MLKIVNNINDELAHKKYLILIFRVQSEDKIMLVNTDRFLLASGQRFYFHEQKIEFQAEIERLNKLYKKNLIKKKELKLAINQSKVEFTNIINRLHIESSNYKLRVFLT